MVIREIRNFLDFTRGQVILIIVAVALFEFFLNLWVLRIENSVDPNIFVAYWGFPFEAIKVRHTVYTGIYPDVGIVIHINRSFELLWGGATGNLLIYIALSIVIVKFANWIRDEVEYRRYNKNS